MGKLLVSSPYSTTARQAKRGNQRYLLVNKGVTVCLRSYGCVCIIFLTNRIDHNRQAELGRTD